MTGDVTSRQIVPKSPACPEGLFLMDGIEGLRSLPKHSVDMLLTDPPYGTTRNFWDVPLPLPELWEAVKWAVKPDGAVLFFAQCPYDKVLGASNLSMLRYEWVWYKSRCTGFLNARRAPLKRTENILVFYQKLPYYDPQFEQGKPYKKISRTGDNSPNYGKFLRSSSGSEDGLRFPGNLLAFSSVQRTVHPTQKPVELCEYLIRTYTRPGEVVADICTGSGTTAVAAVNTGRRFVCFETAPAFYAPATERIRLATEAVKAGQKGVQGAAENHYPTMGIDELCALPVADLAAPDSALFLWATFPQLPEALRLIEAWGFRYKSVAFVWLKKNKQADSWFYGLGFWTRGNAEICLLATKGHPKRQAANIHQFIISPIEAHSKKPDEAREKIVPLMGDLPRVELFARQSPPGWEVWGNEVKSTIPDFGLMGPPQNQRFCGERRNNGADGLRDKVSRGSQAEFVTTSPEVKGAGKEADPCPM